MIAYDHAITLADEIHFIWHRKPQLNIASCIFMATRLFLWIYGVMFLLLELWDDEERMVRTHWCMTNDMFVLELQLITSLQEYLFLFYISNIALWFIAAGKATAIGGIFLLHSMLFSILHASVVRDQPREHICSGCSIMSGTWTHLYQHSASEQSPDPPIAVTHISRTASCLLGLAVLGGLRHVLCDLGGLEEWERNMCVTILSPSGHIKIP